MRKGLLNFSLAKSRTNTDGILKTYQLFIYEDVNDITDSYCVSVLKERQHSRGCWTAYLGALAKLRKAT